MQEVQVTKVMCDADCWMDYRLIVSKPKLHILPQRRLQGQNTTKRLSILKLKKGKVAEDFAKHLDGRFADAIHSSQTSIEEQWSAFKVTVHSAAWNTSDQVPANTKTGSTKTRRRYSHC